MIGRLLGAAKRIRLKPITGGPAREMAILLEQAADRLEQYSRVNPQALEAACRHMLSHRRLAAKSATADPRGYISEAISAYSEALALDIEPVCTPAARSGRKDPGSR